MMQARMAAAPLAALCYNTYVACFLLFFFFIPSLMFVDTGGGRAGPEATMRGAGPPGQEDLQGHPQVVVPMAAGPVQRAALTPDRQSRMNSNEEHFLSAGNKTLCITRKCCSRVLCLRQLINMMTMVIFKT